MENEQAYFRELQPGTTLQDGKYIIERVLGAGGFGITYYARHTSLDQHYAIKEFFIDGRCVRNTMHHTVNLQGIGPELFEKYRKKFTEEAQTLAKLDHPNIVRVIDVFEENETSYIVMPFIEGKTLESLVEKNGLLDYGLTVNYIGQIANAVGYIHKRNILHRDIKPDNIMITADNHAILIDFGSAREFIQDKTQHQTSILTKGYAPIEQYSSNSRKGAYTDIYSLGAVLYYVLTGTKPMDATERLYDTMPEPKQINSQITNTANKTIIKAMQIKPEDRYQSVAEFMMDLVGGMTVPETRVEVKKEVPKKHVDSKQDDLVDVLSAPSTKKTKFSSIVIILIVLISAIGLGLFFYREAKYAEEQARREQRIEELLEQYHKECKKCDYKLQNANDYGKVDYFLEGIMSLREVEKIEQELNNLQYIGDDPQPSDTLFAKLNKKLEKASLVLQNRMENEPEQNEENFRWIKFVENKKKLDFWIQQLPNVNNASDFNIPNFQK